MAPLIDFEAELWPDGPSTLDSSVYMGIHWHDGAQEIILNQALNSLGTITSQGLLPLLNNSLDPHRLQISYGQHAISLNTIRDFYLEQNSAMEYYREYQNKWANSQGKGLMPVHSSGEVERLILDPAALGYNEPLVELIIRRTTTPRGGASSNGQHANAGPNAGASYFAPGRGNWEDDL